MDNAPATKNSYVVMAVFFRVRRFCRWKILENFTAEQKDKKNGFKKCMNTHILFDLDGTLLNSIPTVLDSFRASFAELKKEYPGNEIIQKGIGSHLDEIFSPYFSPEEIPVAIEVYRKKYLEREHLISLFPEVLPALSELSQSFKLGVVTTKLRSFSEDILERLDILDFFEVIVGSEDVERCKPHPDPLLLAAKKFSISPEHAVYIGDSLHDARSAHSAKMPFFGVETGTATKTELQEYGTVFAHVGYFAQFFCSEKK